MYANIVTMFKSDICAAKTLSILLFIQSHCVFVKYKQIFVLLKSLSHSLIILYEICLKNVLHNSYIFC